MTRKTVKILTSAISLFFLALLALTGCGNFQNQTPEATNPPTATPTATPVPKSRLTVCLGEEPQFLYLYNGSSQAMWSILEAIYDGPIDTQNNVAVPVILQNLPTQENGGVQLLSKAVTEGDRVANIDGDVVALKKGVKVFPEGCTTASCAVEWDGAAELKLVQMSATFKIQPGVKWSDGQPLTAADSVFSYQISADADTKVTKTLVNLTADYAATDDQTVKWTGIPGYLTTRPSGFFWIPQPKHLLETLSAADLNTSDLTNKKPIGWGAYQIEEWVPGSQILLVKNPNYFRASEGLPKFDELVFKFLPTVADADLSVMTNAECDIMDTSTSLEDQIQSVRELEITGKLKSYFGQGPSWTAINFGIKPASYDEVYNPYSDRADFFSDLRVRQAFAYCIDRDKIIKDVLFSQSQIPATYLPTTNPLAISGLPVIEHDPQKGMALLDLVGWKDTDGDVNTPRIARSVQNMTLAGQQNVFNDTPFSITYKTTDTPQNRQIAEIVVSSLKECGIEVKAEYSTPADLLAAGPEGPLFGRNFDLAQLSWSSGSVPSCFLYASSEIPSEKNYWLGTKYGGVNLTGYSNPAYDTACAAMLDAGLDRDVFTQNNQTTQQIFSSDLPVLPLYYNLKAMVSRPDLCGLALDTSSRSGLSGIESLEISDSCRP